VGRRKASSHRFDVKIIVRSRVTRP